MASIGNCYGSKYHLEYYLKKHPDILNHSVCKAIRHSLKVCWHNPQNWPEKEWQSLDFLPEENSAVVCDWKERWPSGRGVINWDAVGKIKIDRAWEWVLVEAKSHTGELKTACKAKNPCSIKMIERTFSDVKSDLGAEEEADWQKQFYQYANRLAALHHLDKHRVRAHLLFIYFCGDKFPEGRSENCPKDKAGWGVALHAQAEYLGLGENHCLAQRIHKLFLPVWGEPK